MTTAMPSRVISTGSILVDVAMRIPHLPERGGDVLGATLTRAPGGGFNLAAAVARQDIDCTYAGGIGSGPHGDLIRAALLDEGIEWAGQVTPAEDSGSCFTLVEPDGERTFVTVPGAEARTQADPLAGMSLRPGDLVAVSGYDLAYPLSAAALTAWVQQLPGDVIVALDLGPLIDTIPADVAAKALTRADLVTFNQREARLIAHSDGTGEVLTRAVAGTLPTREGRIVLIREGALGCSVTGGTLGIEVAHIDTPHVVAVDTTGAGDAHTGVLLAELARGTELREAVTIANRAAALTVTRSGPATAPTRAELMAHAHGL